VFVRLDHLSVIVVWTGERDIILGCHFTSDGYLVQGDLVTGRLVQGP
jgi:hypothetical protein